MPWTRRREEREAADAAEKAERERRLEQQRAALREELRRKRANTIVEGIRKLNVED